MKRNRLAIIRGLGPAGAFWLSGLLVLGLGGGLAGVVGAGRAYAQEPSSSRQTSAKVVQRLGRAPVSKEILRVHLPRPNVRKLANGLTVVVLEQHKLPTITLDMWIRPGELDDPKNLPGLATFTAEMLREGTARRSSKDIASEADNMGATLNAEAPFGRSYASVSANGLTDSTEHLLDLVSDVVLHPSFPSEELEKYKKRELANLEEERSRPRFLATEKFNQVLYRDFPASLTAPSVESVKNVSTADLRAYHRRFYIPENSILGLAGDVNSQDAFRLAEKYFGAWSGAAQAGQQLPSLPAPAASKIYVVDRPGSVQTNLVTGDYSVRRNDPDYVVLAVMNRVVGGGPSARLFMNLREEKGYTYGAYSFFQSDVYPGPWVAFTEVRNNVTDGSMHELLYELKRIRDQAVPDSELEEAKHALVATFALSLERPRELLDDWLTVQYYGLPQNYWDNYAERLAQVSAAEVQSAAKKYVDLEHLQIVAVGDAKQIKDVLAKYGSVSVYDANGKPE